MKTLQDLKRELLTNPAIQSEYDGMAAEFDMARELIDARNRACMMQSEVTRLEGGKQTPLNLLFTLYDDKKFAG